MRDVIAQDLTPSSACYERLRRDGKLPATFEVIYGHAWKPQTKTISDGRAIIKTPFKL